LPSLPQLLAGWLSRRCTRHAAAFQGCQSSRIIRSWSTPWKCRLGDIQMADGRRRRRTSYESIVGGPTDRLAKLLSHNSYAEKLSKCYFDFQRSATRSRRRKKNGRPSQTGAHRPLPMPSHRWILGRLERGWVRYSSPASTFFRTWPA
jgi:hypothetical protein